MQVAYLFEEIEQEYLFRNVRPEKLNETASVEEATRRFTDAFERPGDPHFDERREAAEKAYADYAAKR